MYTCVKFCKNCHPFLRTFAFACSPQCLVTARFFQAPANFLTLDLQHRIFMSVLAPQSTLRVPAKQASMAPAYHAPQGHVLYDITCHELSCATPCSHLRTDDPYLQHRFTGHTRPFEMPALLSWSCPATLLELTALPYGTCTFTRLDLAFGQTRFARIRASRTVVEIVNSELVPVCPARGHPWPECP